VAALFGKESAPEVTIGNDAGTAAAINATGSKHVDCPVTEFVIDRKNRIVSTPAYMLAGRISEAYEGITKTVKAVLELC
jgi:enhancing lycopene biosynthesis protein 2